MVKLFRDTVFFLVSDPACSACRDSASLVRGDVRCELGVVLCGCVMGCVVLCLTTVVGALSSTCQHAKGASVRGPRGNSHINNI